LSRRKIRALVVDDSAYNRRTICGLLEEAADVEVVGRAVDGEEGLRFAMDLEPDVITLDLEMPRMDGFTFLRILMSRRPTPVIVISSYARKANVFRALELGAVDFIAKPSRFITEELEGIRVELLSKIRTVRGLKIGNLGRRPQAPPAPLAGSAGGRGPMRLVGLGASTGGPPALQHILGLLPGHLNAAVVVAQHMPARFTQAFAERLDRSASLTIRQAEEGDVLERGLVLLAPGGRQMEVIHDGARLKVALHERGDTDVYVPSIDTLFTSLAEVGGDRALGVVLTGMGRDGRAGIAAIKDAGGSTMVESETTAVVYGMPAEAVETGRVDRILPLDEIPRAIIDYVAEGALPAGGSR
jgi:two-component system, chemotaxis family, protein-glutamate methylesterase/glutaminase